MKLFRKKEVSEEEKDQLDKKIKEKERVKKDFIHGKKTRTKKFEVKPWGKKERIFVLSILVGTMFWSGLLALNARAWKLPNMPRINLPNLIKDDVYVIEGKKGMPKKTNKEILDKFDEMTRPLSGQYGFYVIDLKSGNSYGTNEKEVFDAGSFNKLPVMVTMYHEAELGNVNLSQKYTLKDSDKREGSGSLSGKPSGYKVTYQDLVRAMGHESDNTAFNVSQNILGKDKILMVSDKMGLPDSLLEDNKVSPIEVGDFFKNLVQSKFISDASRDNVLEYLTDTIYENWIPKEINVPVAHKVGILLHVANDAGVVEGDKPFVLVLMGNGIVEKEANEFLPNFAKAVFDFQNRPL